MAGKKIDNMSPASGRMRKEDDSIINIADYIASEEYGTEAERVAYDTTKIPTGITLTYYVCANGAITNIWKYNASVGWVEL